MIFHESQSWKQTKWTAILTNECINKWATILGLVSTMICMKHFADKRSNHIWMGKKKKKERKKLFNSVCYTNQVPLRNTATLSLSLCCFCFFVFCINYWSHFRLKPKQVSPYFNDQYFFTRLLLSLLSSSCCTLSLSLSPNLLINICLSYCTPTTECSFLHLFPTSGSQ